MDRVELFNKLLKLLKGSNREQRILKMVEEIFERFSKAPASGRTEWHSCYEGGLLDHSNVVTLKMLANAQFYQIPTYSIVLTGLFHDLGKVGNKSQNYYIRAEQWKVERGMPYEIPQNIKILPHSARSIHILNQFRIPLTEHEFQAILYHNLLPEDRGLVKHKETPLLLLLYEADVYASHVYETVYKYDKEIMSRMLTMLENYQN